jgi:hypothetical protein
MADMREGFDSWQVLNAAGSLKLAYPELAEKIDGVLKECGLKKCCGGRSVAGKEIVALLLAFKYDGRGLAPLDGVLDPASIEVLKSERTQPEIPVTQRHVILESCKDCVCEHIAESIIYAFEADHGYPWKRHLVAASLEHAAFEAHNMWPDFSDRCREAKLNYRNKNAYNLEKLLKDADALK